MTSLVVKGRHGCRYQRCCCAGGNSVVAAHLVDGGRHVQRNDEDDEKGEVPGGQDGQSHQDWLPVPVAVPRV